MTAFESLIVAISFSSLIVAVLSFHRKKITTHSQTSLRGGYFFTTKK